jgi:thiamine pyrophosphate-dependent acetolactate synthase large subunit-like protein
MSHLSGAKAAIATLRAHDVDTIFGIPGVHTLPLYDAMRDETGLRHILARHEQGAGFMADGYARVSGRVGVVSTITGPGVTNVATAVANAYSDSVPLLVISSSLPRSSTGRPAGKLHEMKDQMGVMEALAGWTRSVEFVEEIPTALFDAFRALRSGRPRAAYLQIPLDLLALEADVEIPEPAAIIPTRPSEQDIAAAVRLLQESQRPLIVAGVGVTMADANAQLARLAERLQAPVLLGNKSHDVLPSDHPLALTLRGSTMPTDLRTLLGESDVVLVVGSKLGGVRTGNGRLPLSPPLIQIDIDPAEIGRNYPAAVGVVADARLALDALLEALPDMSGERPSRAQEVATIREALQKRIRQVFGESVVMLSAVREALPREGVIVADMTMLGYASAEYLPVYEPRTFIHPAELCSIGCGLPLALGAKAAAPDRPVVALCGDGGFLLNMGELATAVQEKLDLVIVVFNDATYTAVKNDQYLHYNRRYIATDLVAPDYVTLAHAFGADGVHVNNPDELQEAISAAIHRPGTTLIEVALPPKQWSA